MAWIAEMECRVFEGYYIGVNLEPKMQIFFKPNDSGEFEVYEQLVSKTNTGDVFVVFAAINRKQIILCIQ